MKQRRKKNAWSKRVWVGFSDGRPDYRIIDTGYGGWGCGYYRTLAIFTDMARARFEYEDVRPMLLTSAEGTEAQPPFKTAQREEK